MRNVRDGLRDTLEPVGTQLIQQKRENDRRRKAEYNIVQADQQRILKNSGKVGRLEEQKFKMFESDPLAPPYPFDRAKILKGQLDAV